MGLAQMFREAAQGYRRVAQANPMDLVRPAQRMSQDDITRTAYGVGGIAGLGAAAIPATAYAMNTDAERLRQEARMRFLMDQIVNGTPELQDRLDMLGLRNEALLMDIADLRSPPDGMTASMRQRVFYPRPNTRRQDNEGFMGGEEP